MESHLAFVQFFLLLLFLLCMGCQFIHKYKSFELSKWVFKYTHNQILNRLAWAESIHIIILHNKNLSILSQRPKKNRKLHPIDTRFDFQIGDFISRYNEIVKLLIEFYSFNSLHCTYKSLLLSLWAPVSAIAYDCHSVICHSLCFIKQVNISSIQYNNSLWVCVSCLHCHKCIQLYTFTSFICADFLGQSCAYWSIYCFYKTLWFAVEQHRIDQFSIK